MTTRRYRLEIRGAIDGQWYVLLVAGNGEIVMTSETYTTRASALRAARMFRRWAWAAKIVAPHQ